jgi:hypothetical protein
VARRFDEARIKAAILPARAERGQIVYRRTKVGVIAEVEKIGPRLKCEAFPKLDLAVTL